MRGLSITEELSMILKSLVQATEKKVFIKIKIRKKKDKDQRTRGPVQKKMMNLVLNIVNARDLCNIV